MSKTRQILYPLFDGENNLAEVIRFAQAICGELHFLYTFRLTDFNKIELFATKKKMVTELSTEIHRRLMDQITAEMGNANIPFELSVEIGFLKDRIQNNIANKNIDTLIINEQLSIDDPEIKQIGLSSGVNIKVIS